MKKHLSVDMEIYATVADAGIYGVNAVGDVGRCIMESMIPPSSML